MGQKVKNLPAVQETWVRFLGQEDALEKEMATHSSILPGGSVVKNLPAKAGKMGSIPDLGRSHKHKPQIN